MTETARAIGDGRSPAKRSGAARAASAALLVVPLIAGLAVLAGWLWWRSLFIGMPTLPPTDELWDKRREAAFEFVDREGRTLAIRGPRYGRAVSVAALPPHVAHAFIAAEDKRFFEHDGADRRALLRAIISNVRAGRTVSGASTITQQLIKNLVLSSEQSLSRKAQEMRLARELEVRLSKEEVLDLYLNRMYFGGGFYGIGAASTFYFGKEAAELSLAEATLLAAILNAPSRMALTDSFDSARERQAYVLTEMVDAGFITASAARQASNAEVQLAKTHFDADPSLNWAFDAAIKEARRILPDVPADLVIQTTIDPVLQASVQTALKARVQRDGPKLGAEQAAVLIMDDAGRVLVMSGGLSYEESAFNRAMQARRQPGSAFKVFVYAAAMEAGLTPYDVRVDGPVALGAYRPENYGGRYIGPVTLGEAFEESLNTVAVMLGQEVGLGRIVQLAQRFGISADLKPYDSLPLGSQETTVWDMASAVGVLMQQGRRFDGHLVSRITNSRGDVLFERPETLNPPVYDEALAAQMTALMARVVRSGTGTRARVRGWDVAGKTGTSQNWRDAWFVGFTGTRIAAVWVGNDDDTPMRRVTGGGLPATIFSEAMTLALEGQPPAPLPGIGSLKPPRPEAQARIALYRGISMDFGVSAGRVPSE